MPIENGERAKERVLPSSENAAVKCGPRSVDLATGVVRKARREKPWALGLKQLPLPNL